MTRNNTVNLDRQPYHEVAVRICAALSEPKNRLLKVEGARVAVPITDDANGPLRAVRPSNRRDVTGSRMKRNEANRAA